MWSESISERMYAFRISWSIASAQKRTLSMYPRNANEAHAVAPHNVRFAGMYPPRTNSLGRSGAVMFTPMGTPYVALDEHPADTPFITKHTS